MGCKVLRGNADAERFAGKLLPNRLHSLWKLHLKGKLALDRMGTNWRNSPKVDFTKGLCTMTMAMRFRGTQLLEYTRLGDASCQRIK